MIKTSGIKIESHKGKTFICVDGRPLKRVLSLKYEAKIGELPRISLEMMADDVEIKSDIPPDLIDIQYKQL